MKRLFAGMSLFLVAGCAAMGGGLKPEEVQEFNSLPSKIVEAKKSSIIKCIDKASCDKAFKLTKVFIQTNSQMKIQQSDDTLITTYNPTQLGKLGINATKEPGAGDTALIEIEINCNDGSRKGNLDSGTRKIAILQCRRNSFLLYDGYSQYMAGKI